MPEGQFPQDPVPTWPAGQSAHALFALLTAHPLPLLHEVEVCDDESCHVLAGHAPQTRFAVVEHALVCFCPAPQEPQLLQVAFAVPSCHVEPAEHAGHAVLPDSCLPASHTPQFVAPSLAWIHPEGHSSHEAWPVAL